MQNSAEIVVLDFQLCTRIWVRATIGQLKKAFVLFVIIASDWLKEFPMEFAPETNRRSRKVNVEENGRG